MCAPTCILLMLLLVDRGLTSPALSLFLRTLPVDYYQLLPKGNPLVSTLTHNDRQSTDSHPQTQHIPTPSSLPERIVTFFLFTTLSDWIFVLIFYPFDLPVMRIFLVPFELHSLSWSSASAIDVSSSVHYTCDRDVDVAQHST